MLTPNRFRTLAAAAVFAALPLFAGAPGDPLAWIPADATAVGQINLRDLKTSELTRDLWDHMDGMTADGDGARFLADAGLDPRQDVETITVAVLPGAKDGHDGVLVIAEGRFDVDRLTRATLARGGSAVARDGRTYIRLPEKHEGESAPEGDHRAGAVAYLSSRLALAGDEPTVAAVLAAPGGGARLLSRGAPSAGATGWFVADTLRLGDRENRGAGRDDASAGAGLAKRINFFSGEFTLEKGRIQFSARVDASDEQSRADLEDMVRGGLAAWRMSAQEKNPELVSVIRGFEVKRDSSGVRISGRIPNEMAQRVLNQRDRDADRPGRPARREGGAGAASATGAAAK